MGSLLSWSHLAYRTGVIFCVLRRTGAKGRRARSATRARGLHVVIPYKNGRLIPTAKRGKEIKQP